MGSDIAAFLAGSDDRVAVLTYLMQQSAAPGTLADDLSLARRSVQRHLAQFVKRGWATKDGGTYSLTTSGELVAEEHTTYRATLARLEEFNAFYRHLPDQDHAPDSRWLQDADMAVATDADPQAPIHHYLSRVRAFDGDHIRMLSPVLSRLFHDAHADLAVKGMHTDLILSADLIARARDLNPIEFNVIASVDVLDLYRHPEPIEFGLTLGENRVLLGAYADDQLTACIEATNQALLAWAADLFDQYQSRAAQV